MKALISVYDKSNLDLLLPVLDKSGYEIVSTGGTAKCIRDLGYQVTEVESLTNLPELLGGRVKTLHPKILAGILARKDNDDDLQDLVKYELPEFDLVIVNLYPFAEVASNPDAELDLVIDNIDIGGITLLRAAAKNFKYMTVLSSPSQYSEFAALLDKPESLDFFRLAVASTAFELSSQYDFLIAKYLRSKSSLAVQESLSIDLILESKLRYGENPQQKAGVYLMPSQTGLLSDFKQLQGKEISFNNILDMHAAFSIVSEYDSNIPCVAIVKHNNPCGVAIAPSIAQAYLEALSCDTVSAFGGIVAANQVVDFVAANEMLNLFLELIIAPSFTPEAVEAFSAKPNLRLVATGSLLDINKQALDIKSLNGGFLVQDFDKSTLDPSQLKMVTKLPVAEHQWVDLLLAWRVVKHCKSNAAVAVLNGKTIGIGVGQTNRLKAIADALANCDFDHRGAVLASDGFLPFADNVDLAVKNHISAIIQPGGSVRDQEVIDACDSANIAMVFTGQRCFKH